MALPELLKMVDLTMLRGRSEDDDGQRTAQRIWRLLFASRVTSHEDIDLIREYAGTGTRGDAFKTGDARRLKKKSAVALDETGREFLVYADFETPQNDLTYHEDPTSRPDELSIDFSTELQPYVEDAEGTACVNTAGYPIRPFPRRYEGLFRLRVEGNRAADNARPSAWAAYVKPACAYNSGPVTVRGRTFAAAKLLVLGMSMRVQRENAYTFERWTWECAINPDGWDVVSIPSRGSHDKIGAIFKGEPPELVQDWPLGASGFLLPDSDSEPANIELKPYQSKDFSAFGWTA
jgi:hypothetical protein